MSIRMMNEIKSQGHPCSGCPYVFTKDSMDCIMGAIPGDCAWYFYKRLMGHRDAAISCEEIRKQYRVYMKKQSKAEKKLEKGIAMLIEVAEIKYGRKYAQFLKRKMGGGIS